jgi:hypothetical protein
MLVKFGSKIQVLAVKPIRKRSSQFPVQSIIFAAHKIYRYEAASNG